MDNIPDIGGGVPTDENGHGPRGQQWCQPCDTKHRVWVLRFVDPDRGDAIYTGPDAEQEARKAWAQAFPAWTCYLFAAAPWSASVASRSPAAGAEGKDSGFITCASHSEHSSPERSAPSAGWRLVPAHPGTCELDDSGWLLAFMVELHANVPDRPSGWADFSDAQRDRIKAAYRAMLAAAPSPPSSAGDTK